MSKKSKGHMTEQEASQEVEIAQKNKHFATLALDNEIYRLRLSGKSASVIARMLNLTVQRVNKAIKEALEEVRKERDELRERMIDLEDARLEALYAALENKILAGETRAVEVALKIRESARKLHGLDKPIVTQSLVVTANLPVSELFEEARRLGLPLPIMEDDIKQIEHQVVTQDGSSPVPVSLMIDLEGPLPGEEKVQAEEKKKEDESQSEST